MNNNFIINVSVLICHENKFLCIKRSLTESVFPGYWGIPGGKVEASDISLEDAVKRECQEEIGMHINTPLQLISNNIVLKNNKSMLYLVFMTNLVSLPIFDIGEEVEDISWKSYEEIIQLEKITPKTAEVIFNFINGRGSCDYL